MSTTWILTQEDASARGESELGGKAWQLAWLSRNGMPVPPWSVLPVQAFEAFLDAHGLRDTLDGLLEGLTPDTAGNIATEIRGHIMAHPLPEAGKAALTEALSRLSGDPEAPFAVRSSVVGEDAENASFAGQMDSFLYQRGLDAIEQSVREVWASAFGERALLYRLRQNLPLDHIRCAVVVQRMIDGQVSGVLFTAHPVNGRRDQALVSACWGAGEGLVSGHCAADEFTLDHDGNLLGSQISHKDVALRFDADAGQGTCEQPVPEADRDRPCLTPEQLRQLMRLGRTIAALRRRPQDIEFTFAEGRLWLLQTRPITALPAPERPKGERIVWDNSNIQESYCGVTTPLTFSFARRAYATVYEQTMRVLGLSDRTIAAHRDMLDNMLGLIKGRVYYNINNWYRGLTLLPGFESNKEAMERMMGLQDPVDFVQETRLTPWQKLARLPAKIRALLGLLLSFAVMERKVAAFRSHFETAYRSIPRDRLHTLEFAELKALADQLDERLLRRWTTPILNDFYVMMSNQQVHKMLARAGIEQVEAVQNNLMAGEEGIESTEPTKFLMRLADSIRQDPELRERLLNTAPEHMLDILQQGWPDIHARCLEYIERYGDRTMGELKLESVTLRQDPAFMFSVLRNFVLRDDLSADALARNEAQLRKDAEQTALKAIRRQSGERGVKRFRKALARLRAAVKHRENMRLARTRMFGLYRDLYREMGERLAEAGALRQADDIFYVTVEELDAWMNGTGVGALAETAAARREQFARWEDEELPHHFYTWGPVYHHNTYIYPHADAQAEAAAAQGDHLKGIGCFPGVVEKPVRLIFSPQDELNLDGQILCTVRTDPGWAPLFPTAGGLLIERGSTLSHSAVVARELGIPAVVNVPGITQRIRDGERVRLDGGSGDVWLLDQAEATTAQEPAHA